MQVFHAIWLVDEHGNHPDPYTLISAEDVEAGRWRVNEAVAEALGIGADYAARHLAHYTRRLAEGGKYDLTIWPYHAMLGGIGHALVSAVEEAVFFHGVARYSQPTSRSRARTRSPSTTRCSGRRSPTGRTATASAGSTPS